MPLVPAPDSKPLVAKDSVEFKIRDENWWQSAAAVAATYDDNPEPSVSSGKLFNRDTGLV
jgi:hypothetical protein